MKIANPQAANRISDYSIATDGTVTITYKDGTTNTVAPKVKYGVEKVADTFYAVSNETLANLTPANFVRAVGAQPLPTGTTVSWMVLQRIYPITTKFIQKLKPKLTMVLQVSSMPSSQISLVIKLLEENGRIILVEQSNSIQI